MEKLQLTFRLSKLSTGKRRESVADHSWRLAMMAMAISPKLKKKVNLEKVLMLAVAHDLSEMDHGDVPLHLHAFDASLKQKKDADEKRTMRRVAKIYPVLGKKLCSLWEEYEKQKTHESRFVKALDKLDARISTIDDPTTRHFSAEKKRRGRILGERIGALCAIDPILMRINEMSIQERIKKCGF